ncbi:MULTISPECIES: hypothetical protein [Neisseria]|uniref:Uncharacterized protein n=1 Tax=Neisseria musculi TaxID=1815583 RepID=A0A7H1ME69_9NEIS|nr:MULTISPECIES: hypothetical protein [Neisseria]MBF0804871.1 hypothetical protein [Neisseria sp. 19428wB4_WF04]QNT59934.1 hypothetical protein H7A79_2657 [Neisseria musculi]TFU39423.1 hypothetical protein E4T99_11210 [Neisseria sp. WF04]
MMKHERTQAYKLIDSIFGLKGFEVPELKQRIRASIVAGNIEPQQVYRELLQYAGKNQTLDGFGESRSWL